MTAEQIRQSFLNFFKSKEHTIVPSSSLLPTDPSVLFTTAGMQQFKEYYLGKPSPYGKNVASCQKCLRTSDIDEVGDERHLTFFEMLGNFSFGGYGKKEAIQWAYEFVVKELGLDIDYVTVFDPAKVSEHDWRKGVPKDEESYHIWKDEVSIPQEKIKLEGVDNFWGPTGSEGPCGPTTEIYVKGIEVWNIVFNEFFCSADKKLKKLDQFGIDTGMGLERLAVVVQKTETVFETDLFQQIVKELEKQSGVAYNNNPHFRIIADHIKSAVFIASEGVLPSNVERGYILRRLIRRAVRYGHILKMPAHFMTSVAEIVIDIYKNVYPEFESSKKDILRVIQTEEEKFEKTIEKGLKELEKMKPKQNLTGLLKFDLNGDKLFDLYATHGFPIELSIEELGKFYKGFDLEIPVDIKETFLRQFHEALKKHQEISRAGAESKFGGGGEFSPKLHTATHLLHAALRKTLGEHVKQMGSDITSERLRFDFSHSQKMTPEEIKKVEELVNEKIKEDLKVERKEMKYTEAIQNGALAFFKEKYPEVVSVYTIGDFSKEICGGPHVQRTSELGHFKIVKEESSGAGVRRIRAVLE